MDIFAIHLNNYLLYTMTHSAKKRKNTIIAIARMILAAIFKMKTIF